MNYQNSDQIVVLVQMFQDCVHDVLAFVGEKAKEEAAEHFEFWTEVSYQEYLERWPEESSDEILGEDYAGTNIYFTIPNPSIDLAHKFIAVTGNLL